MKSQNGLVSAQARSPKRDRKKRKLSAKNGFWSEENPSAAALLNALTSVKSEDFSVRLPLHWTGMARQVADTFAEVVVSSEQKTKELAELRQVASENKALLGALSALERGEFSVRLPHEWTGTAGKLAETFNRVVALNERMATELARLRRLVGREGRIHQRASLGEVGGSWAESVELITTLKNSEQHWLKTNLANFTRMLQGQRDLMAVGRMILSELASVVGAQQGAFYLVQHGTAGTGEGEMQMKLLAGYAHRGQDDEKNEFPLTKTLVGQAVLDKRRILLTDVPGKYATIASGLIEAPPVNVIILPVVFESQVKAVIELASFQSFNSTHQAFLSQLTESIGIVLNTIAANSLTEDLLKQSQSLTNELQSRQLELQKTNLELQEKAKQLFEQNAEVERKNREVEQARQALEEKAEQLAATSRFKSEFLANMSHELRTPLNSLLILADQLAVNPDGNLTSRQVEFAKTIHGSGKDLLRLINDILDLSKIESGTVTLDVRPVLLREICSSVERIFRPVAQNKNLSFNIEMLSDLPIALQTDGQRLEQVLKNLLSNAFKFTERGGVVLKIGSSRSGWSPNHPTLGSQSEVVAFSVTDTGIGIPPEKHAIVFEAFQQADGSTSRRYGGTGLGLAISREIVPLLGGEIVLDSAIGRGSTFILYLPIEIPSTAAPAVTVAEHALSGPTGDVPRPHTPSIASEGAPISDAVVATASDDRYDIRPGDRILLVAEDNLDFGSFICEVGRGRGIKCLLAQDGFSALTLIREYQPDAIILDIGLPHLDGWRLLDRLKSDLGTRHIPVAAISASDECQRGLRMGCLRFSTKPVTGKQIEEVIVALQRFVEEPLRHVLVLEDDPAQQLSIAELIGNPKVEITTAGDAESALLLMEQHEFDCLLLDLRLPGRISGNQLLEEIQRQPRYRNLATVVYTGKVLSAEEETRLNQLARSIVLKDVRSPERLLDQATLRLHNHVADLSEHQLALLKSLHSDQTLLTGRNVLLVDDDIRNVFAMTSVLERFGMAVVAAESGPEALAKLEANPEIDIALMDIMLPEMDGYKVTQAIRSQARFKGLPIVALTAKAMKGDREKCIEAGCSDYLAKPVDIEQLLSVLRLWLHR